MQLRGWCLQRVDDSRIRASRVVLAPGHSSRPFVTKLLHDGVKLVPKPFALGVPPSQVRLKVLVCVQGQRPHSACTGIRLCEEQRRARMYRINISAANMSFNA